MGLCCQKSKQKKITMKTSKTSPQETLPKVHLKLSHYDFFLSLLPLVFFIKVLGDARLFAYKAAHCYAMRVYSFLFYSLVQWELTELKPVHLLFGALESMFRQKKKKTSSRWVIRAKIWHMAIQWLDLRLGVKWMGSERDPVNFKQCPHPLFT